MFISIKYSQLKCHKILVDESFQHPSDQHSSVYYIYAGAGPDSKPSGRLLAQLGNISSREKTQVRSKNNLLQVGSVPKNHFHFRGGSAGASGTSSIGIELLLLFYTDMYMHNLTQLAGALSLYVCLYTQNTMLCVNNRCIRYLLTERIGQALRLQGNNYSKGGLYTSEAC